MNMQLGKLLLYVIEKNVGLGHKEFCSFDDFMFPGISCYAYCEQERLTQIQIIITVCLLSASKKKTHDILQLKSDDWTLAFRSQPYQFHLLIFNSIELN